MSTIQLYSGQVISREDKDGSDFASLLFRRMLAKGRKGQFWSRLLGRSYKLHTLRGTATNYIRLIGLQSVSITQIKGTEGRDTSEDFELNFYPLKEEDELRWKSIVRAWHLGTPLPPVELIKRGDIYYVRDGHHRISVARALGYSTIDAQVYQMD